ncbi:MAG: hypothetical protein M3R13_03130 [Armatimonadota bacterium]|nr:hypothetical protein [Armatimonadota bacterium]
MQENNNDLRVAAAVLGPGFRGSKADLEPDARTKRAQEIADGWQEGKPPQYIADIAAGARPTWVDRKAKLFEVGEYSDKGLRVEAGDLHRLAASLQAPIPVWIEHVESPLEMGYLTDIQAAGNELFGILSLTPEADRILETSGAKSLSLSVSKNLDEIFEVSIVGHPRIESARLFCEDFTETQSDPWKAEALQLREEMRTKRIEKHLDELQRAGKLAPVQRSAAFSLMVSACESGIEESIARFLNSAPALFTLGEIVRQPMQSADLAMEEAEFYSRHFPNLELAEIAKRRNR